MEVTTYSKLKMLVNDREFGYHNKARPLDDDDENKILGSLSLAKNT